MSTKSSKFIAGIKQSTRVTDAQFLDALKAKLKRKVHPWRIGGHGINRIDQTPQT